MKMAKGVPESTSLLHIPPAAVAGETRVWDCGQPSTNCTKLRSAGHNARASSLGGLTSKKEKRGGKRERQRGAKTREG